VHVRFVVITCGIATFLAFKWRIDLRVLRRSAALDGAPLLRRGLRNKSYPVGCPGAVTLSGTELFSYGPGERSFGERPENEIAMLAHNSSSEAANAQQLSFGRGWLSEPCMMLY
jgi:hypothetical protein